MKNQAYLKNYAYGVFFTILMFATLTGRSQQKLINVNGWNAYVHVPWDYNQTTKNYPTILFIPGLGEVGTDANRLISNGPGAYIGQGWNGNVKVGNDSVKFIVISLQPPSAWPGAYSIKTRLDSLRKWYRIGDLHMTGLSMGGWASMNYSTTSTDYAKELATVVSVQGVSITDGTNNFKNTFSTFASQDGSMLNFEQINDYRKGDSAVWAMNLSRSGSADYVQTDFGSGGHCCWSYFYGGGGAIPTKFNVEGNTLNLYEWIARNPSMKGALPVTIESLSAQEDKNDVILAWNTASESNSNYFEIQRSSDGIDFKKIGQVYASGNSNVLKQYFFRDEFPGKGTNLYRLKMVDLDGSYSISKTVSAQIQNPTSLNIKSSVLNSTNGNLKVNILSNSPTSAQIIVTDALGRQVFSKQQSLIQGSNLVSDRLIIPHTGIYYLRIIAGENRITRPLLSE